jgi:hypothetical protein
MIVEYAANAYAIDGYRFDTLVYFLVSLNPRETRICTTYLTMLPLCFTTLMSASLECIMFSRRFGMYFATPSHGLVMTPGMRIWSRRPQYLVGRSDPC